jgi:hypothetical protein
MLKNSIDFISVELDQEEEAKDGVGGGWQTNI